MKVEFVDAKSILVRNSNPADWFGVCYNINVYRGCQHGCIYCDSRSDCYGIENFSDLIIKRNAAELLDKELAKKRKKVTIATGSMSDPYIPAEKRIRLTEKVLKVILKHKFPFHIITKSDLILSDLDLLLEINKVFLSISITITTCNHFIANKIEPKAPSPEQRMRAIEVLSQAGIYTGVLFQPVLPYLLDNETNIKETVYSVASAGAKYIIPWFAVSMRKGQKEYFLDQLDLGFPGLKERYLSTYKQAYTCSSLYSKELYKYFEEECKKHNIVYKMKDVLTYDKSKPYKQMTLWDLLQ
ncbi:MAG: radical SAM protein [Candidatus Cloacimonetes bacterium]|nr:radical SAM protein [Candidatus Cloacimonadota bacterium]